MSGHPAQLTFDLGQRPALGAEDFLVSPSNADAIRTIELWPQWPHHAVIIEGPAGAGKTHLGQVWRLASQAPSLKASELSAAAIGHFAAARALLVENLETGIGDQKILFHLLNAARETGGSLLLTSRVPAPALAVDLPDLMSRLKAVPAVTIAEPDTALLRAVLVKHFMDRQLNIEPDIIEMITLRMERSMAAAGAIVGAIDQRALALRRKVTRPLVREVLLEMGRDVDAEWSAGD